MTPLLVLLYHFPKSVEARRFVSSMLRHGASLAARDRLGRSACDIAASVVQFCPGNSFVSGNVHVWLGF